MIRGSSVQPDLKLVQGGESGAGVLVQHARHVVRLTENVVIGDSRIVVIAGPCSVESEDHISVMARAVAERGAVALRGGAFKPRTSPYTFQGLGSDALRYLSAARAASSLPVVSEVVDVRQVEEMAGSVDMFQVGARNMFNYQLLKELGGQSKPVLLKRAMMATIEEFLGAAEYLLSRGNRNVVLCERGIRSFDSSTRFCLDLAAIPVLREKTDLPIVVDPSHGTGVARYVESMSLAAVAAGADGLLIEVHDRPHEALSDGRQSLDLVQFQELMRKIGVVAHAIGRSL